MTNYAALFFVNTNNPSSPFILNVTKWLVRYNNYPKVIVLQSTDLTQLWEKIQQAKLSINKDSYGG